MTFKICAKSRARLAGSALWSRLSFGDISEGRLLFALLFFLVADAWLVPASAHAQTSLRVSENQRFLVHPDGSPFFYLGDTAWALFHRLKREEAELYLRDRAAKGFTVIQAVAFGPEDGVDQPNAYGHKPFSQGRRRLPNDDYFNHVDWIVDKAAELGLKIGMLPSWGSYWSSGRGLMGRIRPAFFNAGRARDYGEFLGRRYKNKAVFWILGGDRHVVSHRERSVIGAMAEGLRRGDGGAHPITFHPPGGRGSAEWFHTARWLDFNMRQTGHGTLFESTSQAISVDIARTSPIKPVFDGEPLYEDHPISFDAATFGHSTAADIRRPLYWGLFSGGFGHTYGHHSVWQMYSEKRNPVNGPLMPWFEALKRPGSQQVQFARWLLESRPFLSRIPDDGLLVPASVPTAVPGAGDRRFVATRDEQGSYAMIYAPVGRAFTVDLSRLSGETIRAWWFDPRTGRASDAGTFEKSESRQFTPPHDGEQLDWVLVLDDASRNYPPPGSRTTAAGAATPPEVRP